jgi:hypothetical protein
LQNGKTLLWLGTATYAALAMLAYIFYLERTVFIDIAFHLFFIVKDGALAIQNNRFAAVFTQMFPLLATKAGLPLSQVMMAYSLGFVLYYAAIFFLCLRLSRPHALMLLLYNVLMVTGTFYWIQSEFPQGIALALLWWAMAARYVRTEQMPAWAMGAWFVLLLFIVFAHPLLPVVFVFLGLFHLAHRDFSEHKKLILSGLATFAGFAVVKSRFFKTGYDTDASQRFKNLFRPSEYFRSEAWEQFGDLLTRHYYLLAVLLPLVGFWYVRHRAWRKLTLTFGFFFGYLLMVNVSYPQGAEDFYIENLYLPLSLFVIVPLVLDVLPALPLRWATAAVAGILLLRVLHIGLHHAPYTARLNWERDFLKNTPADKLIFPNSAAPMDTLMMNWGTSYEFWLLSTVESGHTRSILIDEDPQQFGWALDKPHSFLTKWGAFEYDKLPRRYFIFRDTVQRYELR